MSVASVNPPINGYILITMTVMVDEDDVMEQIDIDFPRELRNKYKLKFNFSDYHNRHIDYLRTAVHGAIKQNGASNELITFTMHRNLKNMYMFIGYIKLKLL